MSPLNPSQLPAVSPEAAPKATSPLDGIIGDRVRFHRLAAGMSQERLGDLLGLTFQQVQKYEKGTNRISASRLQRIAALLGVPVSVFFDESFDQNTSPESLEMMDFLKSREGVELARVFLRIENPAMRPALLELARAAAISP